MMNRRHLLATAGLAGLGAATTLSAPRAAADQAAKALAWTRTPIGSADTHLDDVACTPDGTWAVGARLVDGFQDTRPLIFVRRGSAWVETPTQVETNSRVDSVAVAGRDDVWAVGALFGEEESSTPLVLRWNGTRWHLVCVGRRLGTDRSA